MYEDTQFGRCGGTLLWIAYHIIYRALLSIPSTSSGCYGKRRQRDPEEGISNNWFDYGTAHDVHIDRSMFLRVQPVRPSRYKTTSF